MTERSTDLPEVELRSGMADSLVWVVTAKQLLLVQAGAINRRMPLMTQAKRLQATAQAGPPVIAAWHADDPQRGHFIPGLDLHEIFSCRLSSHGNYTLRPIQRNAEIQRPEAGENGRAVGRRKHDCQRVEVGFLGCRPAHQAAMTSYRGLPAEERADFDPASMLIEHVARAFLSPEEQARLVIIQPWFKSVEARVLAARRLMCQILRRPCHQLFLTGENLPPHWGLAPYQVGFRSDIDHPNYVRFPYWQQHLGWKELPTLPGYGRYGENLDIERLMKPLRETWGSPLQSGNHPRLYVEPVPREQPGQRLHYGKDTRGFSCRLRSNHMVPKSRSANRLQSACSGQLAWPG
jgi:hypothetical protein